MQAVALSSCVFLWIPASAGIHREQRCPSIVILDLIQNPQGGTVAVIADLIRNPEGRMEIGAPSFPAEAGIHKTMLMYRSPLP